MHGWLAPVRMLFSTGMVAWCAAMLLPAMPHKVLLAGIYWSVMLRDLMLVVQDTSGPSTECRPDPSVVDCTIACNQAMLPH